jgi:DNA mismatch endonuclease (patch repair protein)
MKNVVIPREELEELYVQNELSTRELCKHFGCSYKTIAKILKRYDIRPRDLFESWRVRRKHKLGHITADYLREEYLEKRISIKNLAIKLSIHHQTLRRLFREFGIRTMSKSEAMRGKKKSEEHRLKILAVPRPTKDTSIERLVEGELSRREIGHYKHLPILGVCQSDKAFPDEKIAVFCDGDYWHSIPKAIVKDVRVNRVLTENGWLVLRFSEKDIKESPTKVVDKIVIELTKRRKANGCSSAQVEKENRVFIV